MPNDLNQAISRILSRLYAGDGAEALASLNALIDRHPAIPGLFNIRAAAHERLDAPRRAHDDRRRALILHPGFHQALFNLANAAQRAGDPTRALDLFRRVQRIAPDFAPAHNNAGGVNRDLGEWRAALEDFQAATRADPHHVEARLNLANIWRDLSDHEAAITSYKRVLITRPEHATAWSHIGVASQEISNRAEAIQFQRRAVTLAPNAPEPHRHLANLKHYRADDPHLATLRALLAEPGTTKEGQAKLRFALAKAHDDFADPAGAFEHYRRGNEARKSAIGYTLDQHAALFARIKRAFAAPPPALAREDEDKARPIFIVGMPRSGTTLVEQVLAAHPDVHGAGELDHLSRLAYRYLPANHPDAPRGYASGDLATLRESYLEEITRLGRGKQMVVDKMPSNFQWIGVIRAAFPEARIVNLSRDPRAVAWSLYRHYFPTRAHGYAYDLGDIAGFHALYRDLMAFWAQRAPGEILDLDYEAFTLDPESGTRALLAHCGLRFSAECLNFHLSNRPVKTSSADQVRRAVYRGSSDAWRRYAPFLQTLLGDDDPLGFTRP